MRCTLHTLDRTGDLTLVWDPADPEETEKARAEFERLKAAGYAFFTDAGRPRLKARADGKLEGALVQAPREFQPRQRRTVAVPAMRGG